MKPSIKYLKISVNIITMILLVLVCLFVVPKFISFFMPFIIAGIVALIANPIVKFLEKRLKIKRKAGSIFVIILVLLLVAFILYGVIAKLVQELTGFVRIAPALWENMVNSLQNIKYPVGGRFIRNINPNFQESVNKIVDTVGDGISAGIQDTISNLTNRESDTSLMSSVPNAIISIIMTIIASYMFVADYEFMPSFFKKVIPEKISSRFKIVIDSMKSAVGGYFAAQLKIMAVVYVVLLIGFLVLRVEFAALVALLIAILDFLPFFGTGTVMIPWAIIAAIQSNYKLAIGLFITWALSQLVRQIIQPKLLSDSMGLSPIPTLFLLFIGFKLAGALGLIFAAPIGLIVYNLYKAGVFSNFIISIKMLLNDFSKLRKFTDDDLEKEGFK